MLLKFKEGAKIRNLFDVLFCISSVNFVPMFNFMTNFSIKEQRNGLKSMNDMKILSDIILKKDNKKH